MYIIILCVDVGTYRLHTIMGEANNESHWWQHFIYLMLSCTKENAFETYNFYPCTIFSLDTKLKISVR